VRSGHEPLDRRWAVSSSVCPTIGWAAKVIVKWMRRRSSGSGTRRTNPAQVRRSTIAEVADGNAPAAGCGATSFTTGEGDSSNAVAREQNHEVGDPPVVAGPTTSVTSPVASTTRTEITSEALRRFARPLQSYLPSRLDNLLRTQAFGASPVLCFWVFCAVNVAGGGRVRGMSEVGGPGDKAWEFTAQVRQKARDIGTRALAKAPQSTGPVAQQAQRVVQEKPGAAAVGAALAVLGSLVLRRRPRRRVKEQRFRQARECSRVSRVWRWARALAVLGVLLRRRRQRQEDS
jgi:hypothetical protein